MARDRVDQKWAARLAAFARGEPPKDLCEVSYLHGLTDRCPSPEADWRAYRAASEAEFSRREWGRYVRAMAEADEGSRRRAASRRIPRDPDAVRPMAREEETPMRIFVPSPLLIGGDVDARIKEYAADKRLGYEAAARELQTLEPSLFRRHHDQVMPPDEPTEQERAGGRLHRRITTHAYQVDGENSLKAAVHLADAETRAAYCGLPLVRELAADDSTPSRWTSGGPIEGVARDEQDREAKAALARLEAKARQLVASWAFAAAHGMLSRGAPEPNPVDMRTAMRMLGGRVEFSADKAVARKLVEEKYGPIWSL